MFPLWFCALKFFSLQFIMHFSAPISRATNPAHRILPCTVITQNTNYALHPSVTSSVFLSTQMSCPCRELNSDSSVVEHVPDHHTTQFLFTLWKHCLRNQRALYICLRTSCKESVFTKTRVIHSYNTVYRQCLLYSRNIRRKADGIVAQRDRQCTYKSNIKACSLNHCCRGKAVKYEILWACVSVALVIQHAKHMRSIILTSVACLALPYFSTLSRKRHDFRKQLLNIKCMFGFSLQLLSETFSL